jgi:hypothetical protein
VVWVIRNSGNEKHYLILALKYYYPKFWMPDNLGSGIPELPDIQKKQHMSGAWSCSGRVLMGA